MRLRGSAPHDDFCPSNDGSPGPVDCDFCERLYSADARGYTRGWSDGHSEGRQDERKRSVLLIADAYGKALDAAREAVDRLASDMANWSSAETAAATDATPDLTVDQWLWAQRGVHRALAAIDALRLPPLPTAHYDPAAKDNRP